MKFLKKTLLYFVPAMMMLGPVASCSDFIDIQPENTVPEKGVDFSKTENMYQPVIGVYSNVRTQAAHWANALIMLTRDGDVWTGRVDDQADALQFTNYNYVNSFWALGNVWTTFYDIIRTSNAALESLDGYSKYLEPGSENFKKYESYCGEVKTIRAWAYYQLLNNFGPIVIYRDNYQTDFQRSKLESVYTYLLEELDWAAKKMPRVRPNQMEHKGAVSAFTAEMIAAQVNMVKGDFGEVERLTNDIITYGNFELYDDYYQLFKIPGKLCDESLFEIQCTDFGQSSGEYVGIDQYFNFQGPSWTNVETGNGGGGWNFIGFTDDFLAWVASRGETVRATTSILRANETTPSGDMIKPNSNSQNSQTWNGKAYLPYEQMTHPNTEYGRNNNVRVLRYADVLLMNAEAKVRNGSNGDSPFNEVRRRAKMKELNNVTVDQILDERRMELCTEWCARYIDLVRTGKAASVLGPKGWTSEKAYWPISANHLDDMPQLALPPKE